MIHKMIHKPEKIAWGALAFHGQRNISSEEYVRILRLLYPNLIPDEQTARLVIWHIQQILGGPWEIHMNTPLPDGRLAIEVWMAEFAMMIGGKENE